MDKLLSLWACAMIALASQSVCASTISYSGPDTGPGGADGWAGDTVWYLSVEESNTEGAGGMAAALFGTPTVSGDSIDFNPTNFAAQSQGGGTDITAGDLSFMLVAKPGKVIETLQYSEAGDTTIAGSPSTDATLTSVTAEVFIEVLEVDGAPVGMPVNLTSQLSFTPSDGDYLLNTDSGGGFFYQTNWSGMVSVDIANELFQQNVPFVAGATKLMVTISNTLTATSIDGTSAFIKKKDFDSLSITANVPEPAAALLLATGLVAGVARRR